MEEHLKPIEFAVLNRVAAEINFGEEWKDYNVRKLSNLCNVVQLNLEEAEAFSAVETLELRNLVL